ncbi:MAG: PP2C family serine/threonine-protein phosphatase [Burkholderiaceae bacterium]
MRFSIFQDSVIGARQVNQDRMGYSYTRECLLLIVADGMGGHLRGEVAAQLTLQAVGGLFQRRARPVLADPAGFLDQALQAAHRDILRYQQEHQMPESPRTTVVAAIIQHGHIWWAHAGDSRLYWLRDGRVHQRTEDHSKVQSLLRMGLIRPEEQETHPERNKVLNCLGSPFAPQIELNGAHALRRGDHLLLCSDGVWACVPETDFIGLIESEALRDAVPKLVRRAVVQSGPAADNATALVVRWEADDAPGGFSSADMPEGAMTTTIAMTRDDEQAGTEEITEDEIERTISEIRAAIERSGGR